MPDLLTHIAAGRIASVPMRNGLLILLVLVGSVLPDLASKFLAVIVDAGRVMEVSHMLAGLVLMCYATSLFLHEPERPAGFLALLLGGGLHVGMDVLKTSLTGLPIFFPLTEQEFSAGLFESEDSLYAAPVAVLILGFFLWRSRAK